MVLGKFGEHLLSAITPSNSYASFMLSKLPACTITLYMHTKQVAILIKSESCRFVHSSRITLNQTADFTWKSTNQLKAILLQCSARTNKDSLSHTSRCKFWWKRASLYFFSAHRHSPTFLWAMAVPIVSWPASDNCTSLLCSLTAFS